MDASKDNRGQIILDVAEVADKISYQTEGSLRVTIGSDNTAVLLSLHAVPHYLTASLLASIVPGFKVGEATALKVTVHKLWYRTASYEVYQGGDYLRFVLPSQLVQPGDKVGLFFELLSVEDFIASIPEITLSNSAHLNWVADAATLKNFKVVDGALKFTMLQNNRWSSVKEFTVKGDLVNYPGVTTYFGGIYAEFAVSDYAGRTTDIRIRFDGFTFNGAGLQAVTAGNRAVSLVSYDGLRLQFVSGPENKVTTVYIQPPSESIYGLGEMRTYSGPYLDQVQGRYTNAWQIDNVVFLRNLEKRMLESGGTYDLGRLGSEISYIIGDRNLGLKNINIVEPSVGGRDLYTQDNTVAMQARFLKNFKGDRDTMIQKALSDLAGKLQQDYENQDKMQNGYAILSYLDTDGTVKTIIVEVPRAVGVMAQVVAAPTYRAAG